MSELATLNEMIEFADSFLGDEINQAVLMSGDKDRLCHEIWLDATDWFGPGYITDDLADQLESVVLHRWRLNKNTTKH